MNPYNLSGETLLLDRVIRFFSTIVLKRQMREKDREVIKVEIPRSLAERFRRYVAEKYGMRRGSLSKAVADIIEEKLGRVEQPTGTVDPLVGLGLGSEYLWEGEDLIEALRRRANVPDRCKHNTGAAL